MDDIMSAFTTEDPSSTTLLDDYDDNITDDVTSYCDRSSVRDFRRQYEPPLYWTITLAGGVGNMAVVWIYLHVRRRLKTMTDVFLLNLAVADLLFLLTLPLWAADAAGGWSFGAGPCRVTSALYKVNLFSGTLLLACISVDRYFVIVETTKAQNSKLARRRRGRLVCGGVWLLALLLAAPELVFSQVDSRSYCRMVFPSHLGNRTKILVLSLQVGVGFCLPFVVMAFCYSVIVATLLKTRNFQKHKAMRVVLAVAAAFVLSQLPYSAALVVEAAAASGAALTDCAALKRFDVAQQVLKSVAYTHAGLNPVLYVFVGERFRRDLALMLRCCRPPPVAKTTPAKSRGPLSSTRSVVSDSETSQVLSL